MRTAGSGSKSAFPPKTFRLGCSPIVNLFPQTAEPLLLDQHKYEYPVIPDIRRPNATEVFSVDSVTSIDAATRETVTYRPFYSYRHETFQRKVECFWTATSHPSTRANDDALDVHLSLVDRSMRPAFPESDTLTIRTTCSNRNLPARLPFGSEGGDFELESNASIKRIVALKKPTIPLRPRTDRASLWQLVSHLSLNYLSLVSEGREALQQILRLYDFTDSPATQHMIEGITALKAGRISPAWYRKTAFHSHGAHGWKSSSTRNSSWAVASTCSPASSSSSWRFTHRSILSRSSRRGCATERRFCASGHPGRDRTS